MFETFSGCMETRWLKGGGGGGGGMRFYKQLVFD